MNSLPESNEENVEEDSATSRYQDIPAFDDQCPGDDAVMAQITAVSDDDGQYADADEERMQRLMEFLRANGVTFPSLEIKIVNGLRGLYATKKILNGEVVLHVPRRLMLTTEVAKDSQIGRKIDETKRYVSPYGYMAAFLIDTKKNGGFWKPYVDVVPSKFPGMPLFYDHRHLSYLKGTHIWPMISQQKRQVFEDYHVVRDLLPGTTLAEFSLARMSVVTRVYKLQVDGYETLGMVPLADMLNHTAPSPTHWTGRATNGFTIMAVSDLAAGGEILESYGSRSNGNWLMSHGLCMEVNPENLVEIALQQIRPAHPFHYRTKGLGVVQGRQRFFLVKQSYGHDAVKEMFSYLRLCCMADIPATRRMLAKHSERKDVNQKFLPPISRKNELAALQALAAACLRGFERYETSLEEDIEVLKNPDLVWTMRFAIMAAVSEKRILKYYLDMAKCGIAALQSSSLQLARTVANEMREGRPYAAYFADLQAHLDDFSTLWHVSRLPKRKMRSEGRRIGRGKRVAPVSGK